MTEQEAMYSTATPEDPKSLHSNTARSIRNLALDHMLEHRSAFEGSLGSKSNTRTTTDRITANTEIDTVMEEELAAERERDALDSALDPDLDHYCKRMRSETAQGDELTIRAAAWVLRINIRVLKMNSTTTTIMTLTYPGTPPDLEEGSGTSNSLGSDDQGLRTITIAHYVCQHGGAGHYNPIIHQDKEDYSLEETDIFEVVDDEESPNPESNTHWKDDEEAIPIVTSPTMDTEEPESPDQRHSSWATARAAAAAEIGRDAAVSNSIKAKTDSKGLDLRWGVRPMTFRTEQTTAMPQTRNPRPGEDTGVDWPRTFHVVHKGMSLCHLETGKKRHRILTNGPQPGHGNI